ncbi:hypothetical protein EFR84_11740 [Rhizobium chutanense]|uniref:Uncharacterized protein n=1 Tax=Rhizobium chutanense TaxID=2035448 RepID=A0A3S0T4M5_9HYPH|nr:hypothetical protein EFR84_11740 [Rhizobium chutanense]
MSIFTVVAGVPAAEFTPPSVFLGLDPRIHAGIHQQRAMDPRLKAWVDGGWSEACRHAPLVFLGGEETMRAGTSSSSVLHRLGV